MRCLLQFFALTFYRCSMLVTVCLFCFCFVLFLFLFFAFICFVRFSSLFISCYGLLCFNFFSLLMRYSMLELRKPFLSSILVFVCLFVFFQFSMFRFLFCMYF